MAVRVGWGERGGEYGMMITVRARVMGESNG